MRRLLFSAATCLLGCAAPVPPPGGVAAAEASAQPPQLCEDFLARMHRKPAHAIYVGCTSLPNRQGKPLRAIYRVDGRFAALTEDYLVKAVGLNRLKRSCCQWDSPARQFMDASQREFSITMVSEETLVSSRKAWRKIAQFEIAVEIFTEEI